MISVLDILAVFIGRVIVGVLLMHVAWRIVLLLAAIVHAFAEDINWDAK